MSKNIKTTIFSLLFLITFSFSLAGNDSSSIESKFIGTETTYGPCMQVSPGVYQQAEFQQFYFLWVLIGSSAATGNWRGC